MANHSDDTSLAWVWSQYRGEQASGAKVEVVEVVEGSTVAGRISADRSPGVGADSDIPEPVLAPSSTAGQTNAATGPLLAALILTILGLLWFASADKKTETTTEKVAPPEVSTGSAPVQAQTPPAPAAGETAVPDSAEPRPTASPTAPAPAGEHHAPRHRQRRHH